MGLETNVEITDNISKIILSFVCYKDVCFYGEAAERILELARNDLNSKCSGKKFVSKSIILLPSDYK